MGMENVTFSIHHQTTCTVHGITSIAKVEKYLSTTVITLLN